LEYRKLIQSIRLTLYEETMPHRYQYYTMYNGYYSQSLADK